MSHIGVIGSGFAGLAAASTLAQEGHSVTVFEKNSTPGGRARKFSESGFTFDMGPSWYWMPDVFEQYFQSFGRNTGEFYELQRLDPSYRVVFPNKEIIDIPASFEKLKLLFESIESGSSRKLVKFLAEAQYKYQIGMTDLVFRPGRSWLEFLDFRLARGVFKLQVFSSISSHIRKHFSNPKLIQILEFPVLFLGAKPSDTPALYSLMNYADIKLGTWYPMGGMNKIIEAMTILATDLGVKILTNHEVTKLQFSRSDSRVTHMHAAGQAYEVDAVVASADYHFVEQHLLPKHLRKYDEQYWESRKMSPSSLIYYLGVNKRLPNLRHHNLFFDRSFDKHADEIYTEPVWPTDPLFYVCCPSKSDPSVAPVGNENLFILVPTASGLEGDDEVLRKNYLDRAINRIEENIGEQFADSVVFQRSYAHKNFQEDYHAFKGNAYGLANTLRQTAILKPAMYNSKIKNLIFAGQLTVPGPGVPPSIISGQVAAEELLKIL